MDEEILYSVMEQVAWITINQPEKMNRLTFCGMNQMAEKLEMADQDENVRVIVITGVGDEAFCAGANVDEIQQPSILLNQKNLEAYAEIYRIFRRISKPSIAMIRGYAVAGGCGLAMLPSISLASEKAVFSLPEINIGLWPMIVMAILFRTVGRKKGLNLILRGEPISAHEAERIGMITEVVRPEELRTRVNQLANELKKKSMSTIEIGLKAFYDIADMEYERSVSFLRDMATILNNTPDCIRGIRRFLRQE